METPATSVVSTGTMIAPKRAVMIDDLTRSITIVADPHTDAWAHPSQTVHAKRTQGKKIRSRPGDRPIPENRPVTCSTCRMTYLPSAIPPASTPLEDWVCDSCQGVLG